MREAAARSARSHVPLVMHVIHALRIGGLENGLVNLINNMDATRFRHAIVCMTDYSEFRERIARTDVEVLALHKERLSRWEIYWALYRLFASRRPAIVHGRNWDGLDAMIPARFAGVRVCIQGEHGRDMHDLDGSNKRQQWLRRLNRPFTTHYTTVSCDLAVYLQDRVGVASRDITQIYNGVDTARFRPTGHAPRVFPWRSPGTQQCFVVGTVGRLAAVKDQATLVRACALVARSGNARARQLRLIIVGDGPMRAQLEAGAEREGIAEQVHFAGARDDVPEWFRAMDVFVLPSLAEGISNTILEAMASGLPVVATAVGGNGDLIVDGRTGYLVTPGNADAIAARIVQYLDDPMLCAVHGREARERVERQFSIDAMVDGYQGLYERLLARVGVRDGCVPRHSGVLPD